MGKKTPLYSGGNNPTVTPPQTAMHRAVLPLGQGGTTIEQVVLPFPPSGTTALMRDAGSWT